METVVIGQNSMGNVGEVNGGDGQDWCQGRESGNTDGDGNGSKVIIPTHQLLLLKHPSGLTRVTV